MTRPSPALDCAPNFRDLGGVRTAAGAIVRHGRLFRSEAILSPDEGDRAQLQAIGMRLVCDLRSPGERGRLPNRHWLDAEVELMELDVAANMGPGDQIRSLLRDKPGAAGAQELMIQSYRAFPEACAPALTLLFDRLVRGDVPLLIHCTAGKDRTGFVVAMILSALGVHPHEVLEDYLASGQNPHPFVVHATRTMMEQLLGFPPDEAALDALVGVEAAYLQASFDAIREQHGSVRLYLEEAVGLDAAREKALSLVLLDGEGIQGHGPRPGPRGKR